MFKNVFLIVLSVVLFIPPCFAGVTLSSPANGATVQSPVPLVATASSSNAITGWAVYDGNNLAYRNSTSQLNTSLNLASGSHYLTVKAWDSAGNVSATAFPILVTTGGGAGTTGLTISSPVNSSTVQSPVHFAATANSANPVTGWTIYDGWNLAYRNSSSQLDTSLNLSSGNHTITIKAWNSAGQVQFKILNLLVGQALAPVSVSISVSPTNTSVTSGQSRQFTAAVTGTTNTGVLWFVAGIQGGNTSVGQISTGGVYTAPATGSAMQQTVTAHSVADFNKLANASVSITPVVTLTGRQFYITPNGSDSNNGSAGSPWRSFSKADASVQPGDWVHVAPGNYNMDNENGGRLKTTSSGNASAHIHYVSDQKWGAKLTASMGGSGATWWNQGNYIDIQGFDITGGGSLGIYNEGSGTRMIGNNIHNILASGCPAQGGAGIEDGNYAGSDDDIIGNWVHDIGDFNNPCPLVHGIYHANRGGHIYNNVTFHNEGWGIHLWHGATAVTISNNAVFSNGYGGIIIGAVSGDFPGGSGLDDNTIVTNNIIFRNGLSAGASGCGIVEYGDVGWSNHYVNNLVTQNGPSDWCLVNNSSQGTINANPGFVNYQDNGSGDYHLQSGSPAMGVGTSQGQPSTDFNNGARPQGGDDLGVYQGRAAPGPYPIQ
ncbi:MAG TPA: Ig-like domain-containing protein [Terriglobales bacterium]|nr:Ig-like domain-containing protein [Terriglobales bacterium]